MQLLKHFFTKNNATITPNIHSKINKIKIIEVSLVVLSAPTPEGAVAKARYYGLASGGANQLPAAAARAFTPPPPLPHVARPPRHRITYLLRGAASPVLCRQPNACNANAVSFFSLLSSF